MKVSTVALALFASVAAAAPAPAPAQESLGPIVGGGKGSPGGSPPVGGTVPGETSAVCGSAGLYGIASCCSIDVFGVADLGCSPAPGDPASVSAFRTACTNSGRIAKCCVLEVTGVASVLCRNI
ncbi:Cerato-ulmin [Cladorrhinum samala]|uniref:Cerato-ulmin n=1 Tax=Cladorrhinum samala TaxID=585594 RepID=A0AAV9H7J9_9PEZI|nr:Cerato-ulmin [Cladorrhinum samala]